MTRDEAIGCAQSLIAALTVATDYEASHFADPTVNRAAKALIRAWHEHQAALEEVRAMVTIGCPTCGVPADHWCRTKTGNVYDMRNGPAYFHAARRRELAALAPHPEPHPEHAT